VFCALLYFCVDFCLMSSRVRHFFGFLANEATYALTWKICGPFFCCLGIVLGVFTLIAPHLHKDFSTEDLWDV